MSVLSDIDLYTSVTIGSHGIDSRDLIKARDEAQELIDADNEALAEAQEKGKGDSLGLNTPEGELIAAEYDLLTDDERADLTAIIELVDELDGCCEDWSYGAFFIPDHRWVEYAEEYADEIGAVERNASWPNNAIDWQQAADELAMDYTTVEFDGETYYVR